MPRKKGSGHSITEGIDLRNKQKAMVSELFMELPNKDDYPDYYLAIKNPVALESIKTRVEQGEYKGDNFTMFGKDLKTLTANAKSYNRQGSIIFKDALTLEKSIEEALGVLYSDKEAVMQDQVFANLLCKNDHASTEHGRLVSELFWELPSREDYPDYYQEIARPMALDGIKQKIDGHEYKTLQDFEDDFDLMFANAKQYNTEGSGVYLDAEELQEHFWKTIGKEKVKPVRRPNSASSSNPLKRQKDQSSFVYHGETYRIGDFVHLRSGHDPSDTIVGLIFSLWENSGQHGFDATWFLRPDQFEHPYASQFSETEVVKAIGSHEHLETDVINKCFVLYPSVYVKGRPVQWKEGQLIYVCDQRYNAKKDTVTKIKNWPSVFPKGFVLNEVKLKFFSEPLVITKLPSTATVRRSVNKEPDDPSSRQSTPSDASVATTPSLTPTTPTPASNTSRKRKSANISDLSSPSAPSSQRSAVRCNYSNLATGTPCAGTFPSIQELQRHVTAEHAIVQNVKAPPILKRGRPKKNALADSTESSPQPQDTTVATSVKSQHHSMQGLQSPQEIMSQFDNAARSAPLTSFTHRIRRQLDIKTCNTRKLTKWDTAWATNRRMVNINHSLWNHALRATLRHRLMASRILSITLVNNSASTLNNTMTSHSSSNDTRHKTIPTARTMQHHLIHTSNSILNRRKRTGILTTQGSPTTFKSRLQHSTAVCHSILMRKLLKCQRPSDLKQCRHNGRPVFRKRSCTLPLLALKDTLGTNQSSLFSRSPCQHLLLLHNSQHQHQQQHTRTVSGSSVASTPPATSTRTLTMEGAGLGLSGVTISDHARVTPATSDSGYNGISASSTVTSAVGSFGNNSAISNGQTAWSGSSDMGALHYAPEYVAKRQKQESDYANVSSTVTGSATASVDGTLNGYGNGTMYSAQVPSHSGHGHSFSTSSMESVITSHQGTGGNQSASAPAYNDMTR
ncbi:hypothetical protein BG000_004215 [Podila horticola]|nr:hypothetical protein BG000_004215 [Podila horticola]